MPDDYPDIEPVPDPPTDGNRGSIEEDSQTADLAAADPAAGDER